MLGTLPWRKSAKWTVEEAVTKRHFMAEADIFFEEEENAKELSRVVVHKFITVT